MSIKPLNKFPLFPMNYEESSIFIALSLVEQRGPDQELRDMIDNDPISRIIKQRLDAIGREINYSCQTLISFMSKGNPGNAIMYAHAVHMNTMHAGELTVESFAHAFATGLASEDSLSMCWNAQKSENGGNLVDVRETWERAE